MAAPSIKLCGAAGEVTGSGYLVETGKARVLVDFGMFQGRGATESRNRDLGPVVPGTLDAVVLTHAHIDHSGRLPLLTQGDNGTSWNIHATPASCDLTSILLEDSARIQESDAVRNGDQPLYSVKDATEVMRRCDPLPFGMWRTIASGVSIRLRDSGHILGSASVEMRLAVGGREMQILFSGDIGQKGTPLHRDPDIPTDGDLVFMESTYGDRDHRQFSETISEFKELICKASWEKAKILIPAFAVGRTQILLHVLRELYQSESCPRIPIWLDSPLALRATRLYGKYQDLLDPPTVARGPRLRGADPFTSQLRIVESAAESRELNESWEPGIIIAGSGMCDGGRIIHHLKHHLWRKGVHVLLVGFMPTGSLGRQLIDGAKSVRIFRRDVEVRAQIHTLGGFSAHAGKSGLLEWAEKAVGQPRSPSLPRLVLTHGEDRARAPLAEVIRGLNRCEVHLPARGESITLA